VVHDLDSYCCQLIAYVAEVSKFQRSCVNVKYCLSCSCWASALTWTFFSVPFMNRLVVLTLFWESIYFHLNKWKQPLLCAMNCLRSYWYIYIISILLLFVSIKFTDVKMLINLSVFFRTKGLSIVIINGL
jgi:hypothetical protein